MAPGPGKLFRFDEALRARRKAELLAGVDEAGRGPLAGPVVAAAVLLPPSRDARLDGVRDSKVLSSAGRERCFHAIRACALGIGVGWAGSEEIDRHGILRATLLAMRRALERLSPDPTRCLVLVDGNRAVPGVSFNQEPLVRGDAHSLAVASASIVAKVLRDRWMSRLDARFPGYGFTGHKGYGTAGHLEALERLGPSPAHRRSFEPVSQARLALARR